LDKVHKEPIKIVAAKTPDQKHRYRTAGGTGAKILVVVVWIIGVDIELAIIRIPVGIDETSARPSCSDALSASIMETVLYLSGHDDP
jgi:hypothetical protein